MNCCLNREESILNNIGNKMIKVYSPIVDYSIMFKPEMNTYEIHFYDSIDLEIKFIFDALEIRENKLKVERHIAGTLVEIFL